MISKLFETIFLQIKQGEFNYRNLIYHQQRIDYSCKQLGWRRLHLQPYLAEQQMFYNDLPDGKYRVKVTYNSQATECLFLSFIPCDITSYQLTPIDFCYSLKKDNRDQINSYTANLNPSQEVIFIKDNLITDTSIANLLFFDGKQWFTPESYLLKGTMRQYLLDQQIIQTAVITVEDLRKYKALMTINALQPFSIERAQPMTKIIF